jgi:hypothetical protein
MGECKMAADPWHIVHWNPAALRQSSSTILLHILHTTNTPDDYLSTTYNLPHEQSGLQHKQNVLPNHLYL